MLIGAARLGARLLSISAASRSGSARLMSTTFVLDKFCIRQFDDPEYTGTRIEFEKAAFAQTINEMYDSGKCSLVDGYAPFCKHLFVPNFVKAKENYLAITPENEGLMRSGYDARTELELPVLVRWFPLETAPEPPEGWWIENALRRATFLDVILYSREQIQKETAAKGLDPDDNESAPWGIISVKAQSVDYELPMQPITMMRNALGKEEGGSGVPLVREEYKKSVAFWTEHAPIK